ncbi:MAG: hypothetical protein Q4G68_06135 [Planctomycetia bacterium]|nr:hypothetical protein [Planctomycetia bacterium]
MKRCCVTIFLMTLATLSISLAREPVFSGEEKTTAVVNRTEEAQLQWKSLQEQIARGMKDNVRSEALHAASTILPSDRDPLDIALRRLVPLMDQLEELDSDLDLSLERGEWKDLNQQASEVSPEKVELRQEIFLKVDELKTRVAFKNPLLDFRDLLFIKRKPCLFEQEEGNHMCDQFFGFNALPGGGLFVLRNAFGAEPEVVDLLAGLSVTSGRYKGRKLDKQWGFLSPDLSWENEEIVFAATEITGLPGACVWNTDNCFHLFKIKYHPESATASDLQQLTDGAFNDFDPCFLPSGRIAFISERRGGFGRCHPRIVPTYTLHSMNGDGSDIVTLSYHETNEWQPVVDHNGMILYTRWDYVDRGANNAHHPWITTPDGRDPRAVQGNYNRSAYDRPLFEADLQPVPDSGKLVATAVPHHGQGYGSLVLIDPKTEDDNAMGPVRRITPEQPFPESEQEIYVSGPRNYASCRPLSELFYICVYDAFSDEMRGPDNNYGIYLLDAFGNKVLLYRDPEIACRDAIPIRVTDRPPVIPHKTLVGKPLAPGETFVPSDKDVLPKFAQVGLINVYDTGLPFPENTKIKRLRIVQILPKTTPLESQPRIGYGHQKNTRQVLGTVPVEEDGSALFNMPVNVPVYFQALNENGVAVQSMRSDTYVHEGEQLVCQGCHENRYSTVEQYPNQAYLAMKRAPSEIVPDPLGTRPMNFPLLIQPILDAKCVDCHAKSEDPKAIDLSRGPKEKHFFNSFENLRPFCFFFDHYLWTEPQTIPGQFGSMASPLYKILTSEHYGLELTPEELYRFTVWMDNNCDFYGNDEHVEEQREGAIIKPTLE